MKFAYNACSILGSTLSLAGSSTTLSTSYSSSSIHTTRVLCTTMHALVASRVWIILCILRVMVYAYSCTTTL